MACRLVQGRTHLVGARFEVPIEPSEFSAEAIRRRILVVDDDKFYRLLLRRMLEGLQAEVDECETGEQALQAAAKHVYDVIIMDVHMPGMGGLTAVRTLRDRGYFGRVVAASGLTQEEDRVNGLAVGFDDYVEKPIVRDDLVKILEDADSEPIFSTLAQDKQLAPLIEEFVLSIGSTIRSLEDSLTKQDEQALLQLARNLKGAGSSFGYQDITEEAREIEGKLIAGSSIQSVRNQVGILIDICRQLCLPSG